MSRLSYTPRLSLVIVTVLTLTLAALSLKTEHAFMMSPEEEVSNPNLVVTNTNDSGAGSLRQAITDANAAAGNDAITFSIPAGSPGCTGNRCTISIATALPNLSSNITISGPGANLLTLSRSEAAGIPQFSIFNILEDATVAVSGLTLFNASSAQNGGAIRNNGTLTASGLVISDNEVTVGAGSAIYNFDNGTVTLANSSIWQNIASEFATIYNAGSTVSIVNTTFAGNLNLSTAPGTAIFSESNSVTNVTNCTISENIGKTVSSVAVFKNGGGTGALNLKNSIVSANSGGNTSGITNLGNNLIGGTPRLGPLQLNGGRTQTMALLAGSPALDAGTDQTTLNGAVDNAVTTIIVTDAASIPAGVNLSIRIDSEEMIVTSKTGNTLTVTRGANATTAAAHASGAGVNLAFDQRGTGFPRKADGPDADATQTLDIGALEAGASVEEIPSKSTNEDVPVPTFTFNVGDGATAFTSISATSSNPELVPNSNIVIGPDTPSTRTLSITPAENGSSPDPILIVVLVSKPGQNMFTLFSLTVNPVADTPSVTSANTSANTQTTSGLVISRNPADSNEVTHFKITGITGGSLFKNNGTTPITNGNFITFAEGNAGLKFTPGVTSGSFNVQSSLSSTDAGLGGATATAAITVGCGPTIVTSSNDSGAGTLRDIISTACPGSTITFNMAQVTSPITLTSAELLITKNLTIQGPGTGTLTISGNHASRVFQIQSPFSVSINNLTIAQGNAGGAPGGGVLNNGTLTMANCNFYGNSSTSSGGAVFNSGPSMVLNNCNIGGTSIGQSNTANNGGGIYNSGGSLSITGASIVGNSKNGIFVSGGTATLNSVAITNNSANAFGGGGIVVITTANISNCLIADNVAMNGGAIESQGTTELVNSTLSGNSSSGMGGAIYSPLGTLKTTNTTITNNRSDSDDSGAEQGGGIRHANGTVTLKNTIVAGNFRGSGSTPDDIFSTGTLDTANSFNNLIGIGGSGGLTNGVNSNQVGLANARLAPLANNGGPTKTHALLAGSPALDTGSNAFVTAPPFFGPTFNDQRGTGFLRISDAADANTTQTVDIGSFEANPTVEDISDKSTNEDVSLPPFTFNLGDAATSFTSITATSGNPTLVPNANITVSPDTISTRILSITPALNQNGTAAITVTVTRGTQSMSDTFNLTVNAVADTPSLTSATTIANTQTTSGLVISRNPADGDEVTHFKITGITGGSLFKNNGTTPINNDNFITFAEGNAGLKFTPGTSNGSFMVQASLSSIGDGLSNAATAAITVSCVPTIVTSSNDSGAGTLRDIISAACPGSTITFAANVVGTITLTSGELVINKNLTIQGPGASTLTISGNHTSRVFQIESSFSVSISNLTIAQGNATPGGGVLNNGRLTMTNCNFYGNSSTSSGGAIFNSGLSMDLDGCNIGGTSIGQSNSANNGGGIYSGIGTVSIFGGSIVGNSKNGIFVSGGTATLYSVAITNNSANAFGGGGIAVISTANIVNCLIADNVAMNGGAIQNQGTTVVVNSTFSGNSSSGMGGAIFSPLGTLTVTNTTITNNRSDSDDSGAEQGGGLRHANGTVTLKNTIVVGNFRGSGSTPDDIFSTGTLDTANSFNNLIGIGGSGGLTNGVNSNQVGLANAGLAPLADNGGPTKTYALLAGSPALDAGSNAFVTAPPFITFSDQRGPGFLRVRDAADANTTQTVDIGSFEANPTVEDISDKSTNEDVSLPPFIFNLGDAATFFTGITATSGNPTLVPNTNITVSPDTISTRILSITPAPNQNGTAVITVTVTRGTQSMSDTFNLTVNAVADTPSVTSAITNANTQTTSGLVISRNPADGNEVTHFKITGITGGSLFKNNGTTPITNGNFITFAEGNAGLKFTPGVTNGSFNVQASLSATDAGLGGGTATAAITINPVGGVLSFSSGNYSVAEGAGSRTITVVRSGDTSLAVSVDYISSDNSNPADFIPCTSPGPGFASSRCDFTTAVGTLRFAAGETTKTFNVLISQDNYVEGPETLSLTLSNPTNGAVFGVPQTAILTINDDATEPPTNQVDVSSEFVRSQYHDFLNREPDAPGLAFWTDNIEKCNDPARRPAGQTAAQCIDKQRESTAVAFFAAPEFQITGGFVYHLYKGSLTGSPNYDGGSIGRFPTSLEFLRDLATVSEGIVVNNAISGAVVEANRNRLAAEFVLRPEFIAKYGGLNNTLYVQELFNTTGITPTPAEKQALVDGLTGGTETRASVLRKVVDGTVVLSESMVQYTTTYGHAFINQENSRVFVFMEYVGYLRRNPDQAGYVFWLGKLNFYGGDPFQAEMVRSFILAPEYRQRFGQ